MSAVAITHNPGLATPGIPLPTGDVVLGGPGMPRRVWVAQIMGMPISVTVRGARVRDAATAERLNGAVEKVFAELREVDTTFSMWRASSEANRVARGELAIADACADVRLVHDLTEQAKAITAGWFDAMLPDGRGDARWDPTGLVKGWAVERASLRLSGLVGDWCVNAGGDVVLVPGPDDPQPWLVGIEDPGDRSLVLAAVSLVEGGIATSGSAARGGHVIDPRTGEPVTTPGSLTVHGPSLMWSDVWATAAYASGPRAPDLLAAAGGYGWAVVDRQGSYPTVRSSG